MDPVISETDAKVRKGNRTILALLRDFAPHVSRRRRFQLLFLLGLMLVGAVAELVTIGSVIPFISLLADPSAAMQFPLLQNVFAFFGWDEPGSIVIPMSILFLGIVAFAAGIRLLLLWVSNRYVFALGYDIGVALYYRTLIQPYSFHIAQNTSEIVAAINKVQAVLNGAVKPVLDGLIALALSVAIIGTLMVIQPVAMSIAAAVFTMSYLVIGGVSRMRIRTNGKRIAAAHTQRVRCVQEGLGGIRDIILDNNQKQITGMFAAADRKLRVGQARNSFLNQAPRYLIEAMGVFLIVGMALFLSFQTGGLMNALPVLGALALGAQRLLPLLQKIYAAWARVMGNQQMFADVLKLLELPDSDSHCTLTGDKFITPLPFDRAVQFKDVVFRYSDDAEDVLNRIDVSIEKGQQIGIVGATGSGKSTFVDIIMGLLEPTSGSLLIDGVVIGAGNRRAWQRRISHVPQHIFLADASVAENIALGVSRQEIDMERVAQVARAACIADFIERNPKRYEMPVGERGVQLSGGQRQRIGIARALYGKADLLILDEATSALDETTEAAVMESIRDLGDDFTIVLIAHRTETLKSCDEIFMFESGRIARKGSFEALFGKPETAEVAGTGTGDEQ